MILGRALSKKLGKGVADDSAPQDCHQLEFLREDPPSPSSYLSFHLKHRRLSQVKDQHSQVTKQLNHRAVCQI